MKKKRKTHKPSAASATTEREGEYKEEELEFARRQFGYLKMSSAACDIPFEKGKEVYSYSSSRPFGEISDYDKEYARKTPAGIALFVLAALLILWLVFSFIYRMATEVNTGSVLLSMLPSFFVVAVAAAIMIISALGAWGVFIRFGFRHNLVRPHDAYSRHNIEALKREYRRADEGKAYETSISVRERAVIFMLLGDCYAFTREEVRLSVKLVNGALSLTFFMGGLSFEFPLQLPKSEFVPLKKAFRANMEVERAERSIEKEHDEKGKRLYGGDTLGSLIVSSFFASLILAAAILLIVAHYKWVPGIPPFLGVFFIGGAGLAFCNTFHHIPAVGEVGLPLVFSVILAVIPFWAFVWMETEVFGNAFTARYFFTHCTPYGAGFTFLTAMGVYAFIFSVIKAIDYARFGTAK